MRRLLSTSASRIWALLLLASTLAGVGELMIPELHDGDQQQVTSHVAEAAHDHGAPSEEHTGASQHACHCAHPHAARLVVKNPPPRFALDHERARESLVQPAPDAPAATIFHPPIA